MKREALTHTKMKRLCRSLDIQLYAAVGIMESIWNLAAKESPQGDIGKLSNQDISDAIAWNGSEEKLIEALINAKWFDKDPACRLIVHDWHEHCDDSVHMRLARLGLLFANGTKPKTTRLSVTEREKADAIYSALCAQHAHAVRMPSAEKSMPCDDDFPNAKMSKVSKQMSKVSKQMSKVSKQEESVSTETNVSSISLENNTNGTHAHAVRMLCALPSLAMPLEDKKENSYPYVPFSFSDEQVSEQGNEQTQPDAHPASSVSAVSLNGNGNSHGKAKPAILNPEQQTWFDGLWLGYWRKNDKHPALVAFGKQIRTESAFQQLVSAFDRDKAEMLTRPIDKRPCLGPWINKKPWLDDDLASVPGQVRTSPKEAANEAVYQEILADLRKGKTQ